MTRLARELFQSGQTELDRANTKRVLSILYQAKEPPRLCRVVFSYFTEFIVFSLHLASRNLASGLRDARIPPRADDCAEFWAVLDHRPEFIRMFRASCSLHHGYRLGRDAFFFSFWRIDYAPYAGLGKAVKLHFEPGMARPTPKFWFWNRWHF